MSLAVSPATTLTTAVATSGTFTVPYPTGRGRADFIKSVRCELSALQRIWESPTDFGVTLNASNITVTWRATNTLPAGTVVRLELDVPGDNPREVVYAAGAYQVLSRSNPVHVRHLNLGNPVATNTAALRAAAAVGAGGAFTLIAAGQTFDVPRNVNVTSSGNDATRVFTITGKDEYNQTVVETITGVNTATVQGNKAFKTITSVSVDAACVGNISVGFGNKLGFPVFLPAGGNILKELEDGAAATAGTTVAGLDPQTKSTATTADVRGTYVPNSTPDGSKSFVLIVAVDDADSIGVPQFAG